MKDIKQAILYRSSVRQFLSKPVSDDDLVSIIKIAQKAPSSKLAKSVN